MQIKKATANDLQALQNLEAQFNQERDSWHNLQTQDFHKRKYSRNVITLQDIDSDIIFITQDSQGNSVAFISGSIHSRPNHTLNKLGSIDSLYVLPDHRKNQMARDLFNKLEEEFKSRGCDHITLHTDAENIPAQKFYEKQNMHPVTLEYYRII